MYKLLPLLFLVFLAGSFTTILWQSAIDAKDVRSAAKLVDLELTVAEIDSLLPNLTGYRDDYRALREHNIGNDVAPSLVFDPLPVRGIPQAFDSTPFPGGEALLPQVNLPSKRDALAFYTVRQLGDLLRHKKITSEELTLFFLDRLKKHDPTLHCVITLTEERAIAAARKADREIAAGQYRGPLHGIPYGAKDLLAVADYPTTWGAQPYREQSFDYTATVIEKLDSAGAVLVAKLTLGALAWGDVWYGDTTRNPWDPSRGSSGSSAGSAAATAAGLVPFALGTETLGSIVSNVVNLRAQRTFR